MILRKYFESERFLKKVTASHPFLLYAAEAGRFRKIEAAAICWREDSYTVIRALRRDYCPDSGGFFAQITLVEPALISGSRRGAYSAAS